MCYFSDNEYDNILIFSRILPNKVIRNRPVYRICHMSSTPCTEYILTVGGGD